jgi:choline-glycine betaine transporter
MGTLIIPFTFTLLWLSVFGNSALYEIIHGNAAFARRRWPPGARLLQPAGAVSGVYL